MSTNLFGPTDELSASPFRRIRRILASIGSVIFACFTLVGISWLHSPKELVEVKTVFDTAYVSTANLFQETRSGGDIPVPQPDIVPPSLPLFTGTVVAPEKFTAKNILVKDTKTGMILYKKEPYEAMPIASLTKLMSALIILEAKPDWTRHVTGDRENIFDTHVFPEKEYLLEDLWYAGLVGSSNRAMITMAKTVFESEEIFVKRMNQKARRLGMKDAVFFEPSGLEKENVASASDLLILFNEALRHDKIREALLKPEYNLYAAGERKPHHMWNTNWLLIGWIPHTFSEILGGKTGYIPESGYNFITRITDTKDHTIDVAILGAALHEARFTEARDIAEWAFENYTWPEEVGNHISVVSSTR